MRLREYITSERFIWDDLILRAQRAVREVREMWKKSKAVPRMLFSWPSEPIRSDDGITIRDIVGLPVPEGFPTFKAAVELARRTKSYALLLVERRDDKVVVILESHHGTRCWTLPVRRHGDVDVLEKEEATTDTENIGVLWRPHTARS